MNSKALIGTVLVLYIVLLLFFSVCVCVRGSQRTALDIVT